MKTLVTNYTFNKATKQIVFNDLKTIKLEQLLLITNVTSNTIIYSFADPNLGGSVLGNVLTLDYNTASMSDTDSLQIFIDNGATPSSEEYQEQIFNAMLTLIKSATYARDGADRMRVLMDNNPMLYTYMRNSSSGMSGSTEGWYSPSSWNVVDAREQLKAINDQAVIMAMQKWRVQ